VTKALSSLLTACWLTGLAVGTSGAASVHMPTGATYVTTLPSGADVWCDGTYVGRSPLLVDGLVEGRHTISMLKGGWTAQELNIAVVRGTVAMASSRLSSGKRQPVGTGVESGTLVVRDTPAGAEIFLDGSPLVSVPSRGLVLPAGTHELAVRTARGRSTRAVTIYPDLTTDVIARETAGRRDASAVVAPAEDYLPTNAFAVEGRRITVRYAGHVVIARFGETTYRVDGTATDFDSAPESIGGKLYLPLALLEKLSGDVSNGR